MTARPRVRYLRLQRALEARRLPLRQVVKYPGPLSLGLAALPELAGCRALAGAAGGRALRHDARKASALDRNWEADGVNWQRQRALEARRRAGRELEYQLALAGPVGASVEWLPGEHRAAGEVVRHAGARVRVCNPRSGRESWLCAYRIL